jgi:hypothetical protein
MTSKPKYQFINKAVFFPTQGILVIGDLHLGYDYMIQQSGVLIPERQVREIISEFRDIFKTIKEKKQELNKIIFLGDIKHSFAYEWKEKNYFNEVYDFLKENFKEENIIFIQGNHDTIDYTFKGKLKKFHIEEDIAFIHGHEFINEIFDRKIKTLILGHIHPSVILSDSQGIKKERYKCFLVGKFKGKKTIILPSFLSTTEGTPINDYKESYEDYFSIIPKKDLINFEIYVVGDDKIYIFGKIKKLIKED